MGEKNCLPLEFDFLFISLLCIAPTDPIFKKVSITNGLNLNEIGPNYTFAKMKNCSNYYKLLNNISVRRFSYSLIESFFSDEPKETFFVMQYLKKYKFFYKRYFITKTNSANCLLKDKQINVLAIKSLTVLAGI